MLEYLDIGEFSRLNFSTIFKYNFLSSIDPIMPFTIQYRLNYK